MFDRHALEQEIKALGLDGRCWGNYSRAIADQIEQRLGTPLSPEVRAFAEEVGNLSVGASDVLVSGSIPSASELSCVTETLALRQQSPAMSPDLIAIMRSERAIYAAFSNSNSIAEFDRYHLQPGQELNTWSSFQEFLTWLCDWEKETEPVDDEEI